MTFIAPRRILHWVHRAAVITVLALPHTSHAQPSPSFPSKSITLIVPFQAGGGTDVTARLLAEALAVQLKQSFVIDNRAGAAGAIAAQAVAASPPDGYTLLFTTTGVLAINPSLYKKLTYDPIKDFTPIATATSSANALVVHPSVPAKSISELIAFAKANPGKLTYGSGGSGTSSHLAASLFASMSGAELTHVPYKGATGAMTDFLSGRIDMMVEAYPIHAEYAKQGKVRALGVTSTNTSPLYPGVPRIADTVPGFDVAIWYGFIGPAGMPADVVNKIANAVAAVVSQPKMKEALAAIGSDPLYKPPEEFARFIQSETRKWAEIVRKSGATVN